MRALRPTAIGRAEALRRIFNDWDIAGDLRDRVHIGALPVERNRQDGLGSRGNCRSEVDWIKVVSARIDVGKDRRRSQQSNALPGREKAEGRGYDLVARADADRH